MLTIPLKTRRHVYHGREYGLYFIITKRLSLALPQKPAYHPVFLVQTADRDTPFYLCIALTEKPQPADVGSIVTLLEAEGKAVIVKMGTVRSGLDYKRDLRVYIPRKVLDVIDLSVPHSLPTREVSATIESVSREKKTFIILRIPLKEADMKEALEGVRQ